MPITNPPEIALREFLGATTRHTRRVEIYESDGVTRWAKDTLPRLKDGSISVDYDRDERRTLELTLSNSDRVLINQTGELWYDKIIKVFRGVQVNEQQRSPNIFIISDFVDPELSMGPSFRQALISAGFDSVRLATNAADLDDIADADIVVSLGDATFEQQNLMLTAYASGKSVYAQGLEAWAWIQENYSPAVSHTSDSQYIISPNTSSVHPASKGWTSFEYYDQGLVNFVGNPMPGGGAATGWPINNGTLAYDPNGNGTASPTIEVSATAGQSPYFEWTIPASQFRGQAIGAAFRVRARVASADDFTLRFSFKQSGSEMSNSSVNASANTFGFARVKWDADIPQGCDEIVVRLQMNDPAAATGVQFAVREGFIFFGLNRNHTLELVDDFFDPTTIDIDDEFIYSWSGTAYNSPSRREPYANRSMQVSSSEWSPLATNPNQPDQAYLHAFSNSAGGRAIMLTLETSPNQYDYEEFSRMLGSSFEWLSNVKVMESWECQIGEFMIDRIVEPHFPFEFRITGRDYTKKCMLSKYAEATQFVAGMAPESIIASIAGSAGIARRSLPATGEVVDRDFFFDRGTTRWEAMKEVAKAYDYELYFDATGYLTMRKHQDPATTAPTVWIKTGAEGQVASYEKSTSDSRLFNSIVVVGESTSASSVPVYAKAKNETAGSPTSILKLGERVFIYTSSFITTVEQAQALADTYLRIYSLEEFELSFESLMLPWLEVGDIMGFIDPNKADDDPDTFLLSNLTLGLGLGPMSGVGKRVIIVDSAP